MCLYINGEIPTSAGAGVIGSNVPQLNSPASTALAWVITVTDGVIMTLMVDVHAGGQSSLGHTSAMFDNREQMLMYDQSSFVNNY